MSPKQWIIWSKFVWNLIIVSHGISVYVLAFQFTSYDILPSFKVRPLFLWCARKVVVRFIDNQVAIKTQLFTTLIRLWTVLCAYGALDILKTCQLSALHFNGAWGGGLEFWSKLFILGTWDLQIRIWSTKYIIAQVKMYWTYKSPNA